MMTAEVDASFLSLGDGFPGKVFMQSPMDRRSQRSASTLHVNVNMHHDRGKMKTMGYRDTRAKSPPPFDDEPHDFGLHSPELPKFDYNNDRIQNDLLQEICSDIGIKDAMDLDFFDFDAEPLDFLDRRLSDKDGMGGLDQVIPFGQIQKEAEDADAKQEQTNPLLLAMTTAGITPVSSSHIQVVSPSKRAPSLCSSPIRNSNLEKFQSVSDATIHSPAKSQFSASQYSSSPAKSTHSDRFSGVGSPCAPRSVDSQRSTITPKPVNSPYPPPSPLRRHLSLDESCQGQVMVKHLDGVTVKSEDGATSVRPADRNVHPVSSAGGKLSSSQGLSANPQLQNVRSTSSYVPYKQMPRGASGQGRNLSSPFDPGYYSAGSPSMYAASHCDSTSDVDHKCVTPPLGDDVQSSTDKVNNYLDRNVLPAQTSQTAGGMPPSGDLKHDQASALPQVKSEGQGHGGRSTPEVKTEMKPPCTPTREPTVLDEKRQQWMLHQRSMAPGGQPENQNPPQLGIPGYQAAPSTLRSGSNPSSPKKARTANVFLPRPQASAYQPQPQSGQSLQVPPGSLSSQEQLAQNPIMSAIPPQSPFHPQHLRGTPIANQQLENPSGQQMKRRHGFTPPALTLSNPAQPRTPRKGMSKMPYHGLPVDPSTLPVFASQHGFVQQLILDRSAAFRSHPLFPLLRDLIIADMNFYQPTFPFQLINNLPRDFDRLLTNYMQRNPSQTPQEGNEAIEGVIMDALRYAHKALTEKILQKNKDEGIDPNKPSSAIEAFCAQFDISVKSTFPGKKGADQMPTSTMGQNSASNQAVDTPAVGALPPGRTPSRGQYVHQPQVSTVPSSGMMGNSIQQPMPSQIASKNAYMMNTSVAPSETNQSGVSSASAAGMPYNSGGMQPNMRPQANYGPNHNNTMYSSMPSHMPASQDRYTPQNAGMPPNTRMHPSGRMTPTGGVQQTGGVPPHAASMPQTGALNPSEAMYPNKDVNSESNVMYGNNSMMHHNVGPGPMTSDRRGQHMYPNHGMGRYTPPNNDNMQMNNNNNNNNNNGNPDGSMYRNAHLQHSNNGMNVPSGHRMYQNPRMQLPSQSSAPNSVMPSHGMMPNDGMHHGQNVLNNPGMPPSGGGQGNGMVPSNTGMPNMHSNYGGMPSGNYGMPRPQMMPPNNAVGQHQRMPNPHMSQVRPQNPNYAMQRGMHGAPQNYPPPGGAPMHRSRVNPNLAMDGLTNMNLVETMRRQFPQTKYFADSNSNIHPGFHDNKENLSHVNMPGQDLIKSETLLIDFESEIIPPINVSPEQKSRSPPVSSDTSLPPTSSSVNASSQGSTHTSGNLSTITQTELLITTSEPSDRPASNGPSSGGSARSQTMTVMHPLSSGDSSESGAEGNTENMMSGQNLPKKHQVLPKEAVAIMVEWLQHHTDNPYPKEDEKEVLMKQTNLTINQINYWFTNARRRILPKWRLQRILEEQARATGEDPNKVKVTGSAQEIRAITKDLLQGRTVETFLANSKILGAGAPQGMGPLGGCPPVGMSALSQNSMSGMSMSMNNNYNDMPYPGAGLTNPHMPPGGGNTQLNDIHEMHHGNMGHGVYGNQGITPDHLAASYNTQHDQSQTFQDPTSRMGPTLQQL